MFIYVLYIFGFHRVYDRVGTVLFSTAASSPYDLALVQVKDSVPDTVIPEMTQIFNPGGIKYSPL